MHKAGTLPSLPLEAHSECVEVAVRKALFISHVYIIYVGIVKENKLHLKEIAFSI